MKDIEYQILDSIEASIYWKDLSGRYIGCNKYMAKMAGLSREELIGNTDYLLPWKEQANRIKELDQLVIDNKKKYEFEESPTVAGNIIKTFLSTKSPIFDSNDKVIGIIGVSVDITHNKKFEKEFEKTEKILDEYSSMKTRFLQNLSHEARIPMNSVASIAECLSTDWDKYDEKTKKENIDLIYQESKRLSTFIINTFDMSNLIKGDLEPNFKKYNFSQLIKDITKKYRDSFCKEKVEIILNNFDDYNFAFDEKLITQVIENLLMNAVAYSQKNKKITIDIYKSHLKNGTIPAVHCCITDEGIGVPEQELESIFNPFTESSRTASKACGTGLGLSICKEIMDLHSGEIWAENNSLKSGTTFNFCIPTNLFSFSFGDKLNKENEKNSLVSSDLKKICDVTNKKPFALIGISPFNSYFSSEKILEICEWINQQYEDFAIFYPDKISKYNLEAFGYDEVKADSKASKQDRYTINKIQKSLDEFYLRNPNKSNIKVYTISMLKENTTYQSLYQNYLNLFYNSKIFRNYCLKITHSILLNDKDKAEMNDFHKNIALNTAVQYLLLELPAMINASAILGTESCDFVYHAFPEQLKTLCSDKNFIPENQGFLILK